MVGEVVKKSWQFVEELCSVKEESSIFIYHSIVGQICLEIWFGWFGRNKKVLHRNWVGT